MESGMDPDQQQEIEMAATIQLTKQWNAPCWCKGTPCSANPDADHVTSIAKGTEIEGVTLVPTGVSAVRAEFVYKEEVFFLTNWTNEPPVFAVVVR